MVIPNLAMNFILGCESFVQWQAVINFVLSNLQIDQDDNFCLIPFAGSDSLPNTDRYLEENIVDDTFVVRI